MTRWITITALLAALAWPTSAQAAPSAKPPAQLVRLNRAFARLIELTTARGKLLQRLKRYQTTIRRTRARRAGPARDYKLRRLLAGAQTLARRLQAHDKKLAKARTRLLAARKILIQALARLKKNQKSRARRALVQTARKGRLTVLRIARARLDPLDGPRQILEKADLLADSAEKIRKRLQEIDQVIKRLGKRQKLRRIARRVDRYSGLFGEDTSRRRVTRIRPTKAPAGTLDPGVPAEGLQATNDMDASYNSGPRGAFADDGLGRSGASSSTYAVVLKELLTPATLAALRKAGRSSDPRLRMAALKKARVELRRAAARLKSRARGYRVKAKQLKRREQRRR